MAFADRSLSLDQDVQEISRFSCMLFLSVRGFLDYAGPSNPLAITWLLFCLPPLRNGVGILFQTGFSKLNHPAHRYPCLRFKRYLAISPARLEARMDSLLLSCRALSSPTTCRFIPALSENPVSRDLSENRLTLLSFCNAPAGTMLVGIHR